MPTKTPEAAKPRAPRDEMMQIRSKELRQPPPNLATRTLSLIVQLNLPTPRVWLDPIYPLNLALCGTECSVDEPQGLVERVCPIRVLILKG